jgi:hypothetical protein
MLKENARSVEIKQGNQIGMRMVMYVRIFRVLTHAAKPPEATAPTTMTDIQFIMAMPPRGTLAISGSRPYANHTAGAYRESAALLGST